MIGGLLVAGDSLYAGTNGGFLVALDRENGAERWRREIGKEIWATPVRAGEAIVIASMDGRLTAFSADGTERWQEKVAEAGIAGTPAVQGETLYAGSFDKRLYAVDARNGETLWRSPEAGNWFWTEPLVDGDNLYAGNLDGKVYAYDRRTGEERWQSDVDGPVRGRTALDGGVLLVPVKNGRLWGLRPESGTRAWEPVTIGGRLYTDLVPATGGVLLATETGRKSHRLYRIDAGQGSVNEIALTP
jgi:outer membrane protein assembly factor BamB